MRTESSEAVTLGSRLRAARLSRGVGLRALAAEIGVSPATLSEVENGKTGLSVERLYAIARALQYSAGDILDGRAFVPGLDAAAGLTDGAWRRYDPLELSPVLSAGLAEFLAVGYHGATMRRIAARCGLSVSSVYHHHPSKQHILLTLVEYTMVDLAGRADAARAEGRDPVTRFCRLVENMALFHTHRSRLAFLGDSEMRSFTPPNRARIAAMRTRQQRVVDAEVDASVREGVFRADHPHEAARAVITMCTSLAGWYRPGGLLRPEHIAEQYVGFALDLMRRQRPLRHEPSAQQAGRVRWPGLVTIS